MGRPARFLLLRLTIASAAAVGPRCLADGLDTEHIFGFMIGSDVGEPGDREFQSQITGRFGKGAGRYRAAEQEFELEAVPADNLRVEIGTSIAGHDIAGAPDIDDRRQLGWQGVAADLRYKFLDRHHAPLGFTIDFETQAARVDDITGASARNTGAGVTAVLERDVVPDRAVAAVNVFYRPEWTRFNATGAAVQDSILGASFGTMAQLRPGLLLGAEARYMRSYDGAGLQSVSGQAVFVGPVAYIQLSERARLTVAWSIQAWGRPIGSAASLDLANFERQQARLVFGINF